MNYFIITEGRAGSTLLCEFLTQMGIGKPHPYLSKDVMLRKVKSADDIEDFLDSRRRNGILGIKISWGILSAMDSYFEMGLNVHEFLNTVAPNAKYIYQTRRDRVHQALSRIKHLKMDTSHVKSEREKRKYEEKEKKRLSRASVPLGEIHERLVRNALGYKAWDIYFRAYGIEPLQIVFEDFIANKKKTLQQICAFLGVSHTEMKLTEKLIATHTEINDQWHAKILKGYTQYV